MSLSRAPEPAPNAERSRDTVRPDLDSLTMPKPTAEPAAEKPWHNRATTQVAYRADPEKSAGHPFLTMKTDAEMIKITLDSLNTLPSTVPLHPGFSAIPGQLTKLLTHKDNEVKAGAAKLLGNIAEHLEDPKDALKALEKVAASKESPEALVKAAKESIKQIKEAQK